MSALFFIISCLIFAVSANELNSNEGSCKFSLGADIQMYTPDMANTCADAVKVQINKELNASLTYLTMGAYFSRDTINLPGFAKFFFDSASEEREHAVKLMQYLSMRGELTTVNNLIDFPKMTKFEWTNGLKALEDAVELEGLVTESIKNLIHTCETPAKGFSDFHISDWLTGEYLEEQYKGLRDLSGKIFSLKKLKNNKESSAKDLADFIFDKKLLGMDM